MLRVGSLALIGLSANERRQNEDKGREDCFGPFSEREEQGNEFSAVNRKIA